MPPPSPAVRDRRGGREQRENTVADQGGVNTEADQGGVNTVADQGGAGDECRPGVAVRRRLLRAPSVLEPLAREGLCHVKRWASVKRLAQHLQSFDRCKHRQSEEIRGNPMRSANALPAQPPEGAGHIRGWSALELTADATSFT